jgi:hypothetical protein
MHSVLTAREKIVIKLNRDRRSFSRIPADFGIKYKIISIPESMSPSMENTYLEGKISNLSASGLMLQTVEPIESDALVALNFSLPSFNRRIRSLAEVIHVSFKRKKHHAGIRFLKLGLNDAINIMQYVSEY